MVFESPQGVNYFNLIAAIDLQISAILKANVVLFSLINWVRAKINEDVQIMSSGSKGKMSK